MIPSFLTVPLIIKDATVTVDNYKNPFTILASFQTTHSNLILEENSLPALKPFYFLFSLRFSPFYAVLTK